MTPMQARELAAALAAAADAADAAGLAEIDLMRVLTGADDVARRELQAAIDAARAGA